MSAARHIRRLAFQALFQLDARGEADTEHVRDGLRALEWGTDHAVTGGEGAAEGGGEAAARIDEAMRLAQSAYQMRVKADASVSKVAPKWPVGRQAAVDRAILRLAYHEMATGRTPAAVAIDEAVELAKQFGGEKSPGFVNGVLDAIAKGSLASSLAATEAKSAPAGVAAVAQSASDHVVQPGDPAPGQ